MVHLPLLVGGSMFHGLPALRSASGIAGWTAVNRRPVLNAEPSLDLGMRAECAPALRS